MGDKTFVGFGFGAIQAGLFLFEADRSGSFRRLVVAEVMPEVVRGVREAGGRYGLNVAGRDGVTAFEVGGVEILNPCNDGDRERLVSAVAEADEIATALPSVSFYDRGGAASVAGILAEAMTRAGEGRRTVVYAAENHNHAAELLRDAVSASASGRLQEQQPYAFLNTVIGKMSGIVDDPAQMREQGLAPLTPGSQRCFLVEAFNRILVSRVPWEGYRRGLRVFEEKDDLLPFEEAKLYGHNATHALIGYLAAERGHTWMSDAGKDAELMAFAREAFLEESGAALCRKYAGVDDLFTPGGFRAYADDLLDRMVNPYLRDAVARITRDPRRKLAWDDRLIGTVRLAVRQGIRPWRYARAAASAARQLAREEGGRRGPRELLSGIWGHETGISDDEQRQVVAMLFDGATEERESR